jgi:hypothetical protein
MRDRCAGTGLALSAANYVVLGVRRALLGGHSLLQFAGRAFCSARFAYPQQPNAFPRRGHATAVRRHKLKGCRSRSAPLGQGTDCNLNPLPELLVPRHYNL